MVLLLDFWQGIYYKIPVAVGSGGKILVKGDSKEIERVDKNFRHGYIMIERVEQY